MPKKTPAAGRTSGSRRPPALDSDPGAEAWQAHVRRSFAASRDSAREPDAARLLQASKAPSPGQYVRRVALARAMREASRTQTSRTPGRTRGPCDRSR